MNQSTEKTRKFRKVGGFDGPISHIECTQKMELYKIYKDGRKKRRITYMDIDDVIEFVREGHMEEIT